MAYPHGKSANDQVANAVEVILAAPKKVPEGTKELLSAGNAAQNQWSFQVAMYWRVPTIVLFMCGDIYI